MSPSQSTHTHTHTHLVLDISAPWLHLALSRLLCRNPPSGSAPRHHPPPPHRFYICPPPTPSRSAQPSSPSAPGSRNRSPVSTPIGPSARPTIAASPAGFASALHNWSVLRSNTPPPSQDLREYLAAFYHGLPVKSLDKPLRWVPWAKGDFETKKKAGKVPEYVGLATPSGACTGVRCRENDFERDGLGHVQLNLSDILDALIEMVPDDAHSVMMIVNHDLYEDEDDDFCAGRAFGGSRVAVVSTFRYNPGIDASRDEVDYDHIWPATHCIEYLKAIYLQESGQKQKKSPGPLFADNIESVDSPGAMPAAVRAAAASSASSLDANGLWLARV
ncbi:hypothetical protein jhhlp_003386 [Lomentospora prolificans]|uniref:Uncharacterized protein n=1 Tax=Lomentospora prolificans TaxID=41688 RepID=A0A2N3NCD6_9PEZI|nr:hypothetical protein jhhlp_003386 [Lomentospora prolificans]